MINEYRRLLNLDSLSELLDCNAGYMDNEDCSWYHHNWMLMRYLGMVSNPFWHKDFYFTAIKKYVDFRGHTLIIGTADFSMPLLCQNAGIKEITISDICNTPLNICKNVSQFNGFSWTTEQNNIFYGLSDQFSTIINDAFLTRFPYANKRIVFEKIHDGLKNNGIYITTLRHAWNNFSPVIPTESEKKEFIDRAIKSAAEKNIDTLIAEKSASEYIQRMISYPIRDEQMLKELIEGLFVIEHLSTENVCGECVPTEYYNVILRKKGK